MDLNESIKLVSKDGKIELPLINLLRITVVYLIRMLPEFYEDPNKQSNSIQEFMKWIEPKLGLGKGKSLLM